MTREDAAKRAKKLWGKNSLIVARDHRSSPELRAAARKTCDEANAEILSIDDEIKRRLAQLDWYQELLQRRKHAVSLRQRHIGSAGYHRFSVGITNGFGFFVYGEGDSWEEAFANAAKNPQAR